MSLDEKFLPLQIAFYENVNNFFKTIARLFGYPNNPGMSTTGNISNEVYRRSQFLKNLPVHQTSWPTRQAAENWWEVFLGIIPKVDIIPRYVYESQELDCSGDYCLAFLREGCKITRLT